jgi:hypothetical protein
MSRNPYQMDFKLIRVQPPQHFLALVDIKMHFRRYPSGPQGLNWAQTVGQVGIFTQLVSLISAVNTLEGSCKQYLTCHTPRSLFRAWDQSIPWEGTWKLPDISYFTDLRRLLWFRKIPCGLFPKPLKENIFNVSGIFNEDYLRSLTFWEKSKNRFGLSTLKLSKNRWFFFSAHKFVHYLLGSEINRLI